MPGAAGYNVYERRTDETGWRSEPAAQVPAADAVDDAAGGSDFVVELEGVRGDDWIFGVSSVAPDGSESPVASAVPGGGYAPLESD